MAYGGGRLLYIVAILKLFIRSKTKLVIYPYSEELPRRTKEKNLKGYLTTKALSFFNIIHCGWYGIADLLNTKLKEKILIFPMGLNEDFYKISEYPDKEIANLINKIDKDSYNFYYPKSFTNSSRHDLVIEAVRILNDEEELPPYKVYFIGGNVIDNKRFEFLNNLISNYRLTENIIILPKTKFFKTEDLNLIWRNIDCGLQIAERDGISTTIFEPLINKKDLIISDIPPYKYIKSFFGFDLELTPLDAKAIAVEMKNKILGVNIRSDKEKIQIKNIIQSKYKFENNLTQLLLKFEKDN